MNANAHEDIDDGTIAWGLSVDEAFKKKVFDICGRLGCDPNHLMAAMAFETGESFSPKKKSPVSTATGLIQFMDQTAKGLGTTTAKLAGMTAVDQLDYVEKYFKPYKGKMNTLSDVYMAILWPAGVGKSASYVLFKSGSPNYKPNKGLDTNKDGQVTKVEATSKVYAKLVKGLGAAYRG